MAGIASSLRDLGRLLESKRWLENLTLCVKSDLKIIVW